ncbi:hypothetical protein Ppa06_58190 [Planomonospora parontospora subsp. parontospora]|uniref:Uncharacterized protein n=2 Tax=Planomonospora parontospora TaxID=58119 RepID=A0AA37BLS5_9ACTN|nr:hypothetical protein [Planomonospora parontospora]GGK90280.1 hypothetical protein GCM10010126_57120 [Planomonospora parontospora]GII12021.1 hypothetical protein Ppa06_58190 [Planomonospora parontospora subsp. parontospora]
MAVKARLTEKTIALKTPAAGTHVLWRAPVPCKVRAVRAYRVGGTGAAVNATKTTIDPQTSNPVTTNLLPTDLSVGTAARWASGALAAAPVLKLNAGDTLTAVVVSVAGSPTDLIVQIDVEQDANT